MESENLIVEFLKEFFDKQVKKGWENSFLDELHKDFSKIMDDFGHYVVDNQQHVNDNRFDFSEVASLIIQEVCNIKIECIKAHGKHLLANAAQARIDSRIKGY